MLRLRETLRAAYEAQGMSWMDEPPCGPITPISDSESESDSDADEEEDEEDADGTGPTGTEQEAQCSETIRIGRWIAPLAENGERRSVG